jgi:tetratricopeptide (TPR) repeat protein
MVLYFNEIAKEAIDSFRRYLLETGNMAQAHHLCSLAEQYCDLSSRQGRVDMSYLYNSYGIIEFQHDRLEEAMAWFEKSHTLRKENLEPRDVNVGHPMMNKAMVLRAMRRYEDALAMLQELMVFVKNSGHLGTRLDMGSHANASPILIFLGRLDEAEKELGITETFFRDDPKWPMQSQLGG